MKRLIADGEHERVLQTAVDVPEERPSFPLPLSEVGIANKTVWVRLPQGMIAFTARLHVDLQAGIRGIHMSRMEEAISELHEKQFKDLKEYGEELGRRMIVRQQAQKGVVRLSGRLPLVRRTMVSERTSVDSMNVSADIEVGRNDNDVRVVSMLGVGVSHMTACPCTQVYNRVLFDGSGEASPFPTHTQRSYTQLKVETGENGPTYDELLACLTDALHVTQDLQKRPDEAEMVLQSHHAPQFAEDAVRETARSAGLHLGSMLPGSARLVIESLSLESIHTHDVCCRLETTLGEVLDSLRTGS